MAPSDAELATQALAGSQDAYRALVSRYAATVLNLASRLIHDASLAEDLAQEAFTRAFARLDTYDPQRRFSSWLLQVVHNVCVDHLRRKRVQTVSLESRTVGERQSPDHGNSPALRAEQGELARDVARALSQIRPEYRAALILHYQEGLTYAEVASAMAVPVGTVKTYLHRGRQDLAGLLARLGWGPDRSDPVETDGGRNP